jgi:rare lipoprotein A
MTAHKGLSSRFIPAVIALISFGFLGACASVQPRYDIGSGTSRETQGPQVAADAHYKSSTLRPYTVHGETYYPEIPQPGYTETGLASWYGYESPSHTTADGEVFDTDLITAAHKTFPLPSIVEVTNLDNGKTIRVRVNDRGPFVDGRIMDLSRASAKALGVYGAGTARVKVTWLGPADAIAGTPVYVARADPDAPPSRPDGDAFSYIVQLGAFAQSDNASTAQSRMDGALISRRGDLYIVYLGPFRGAGAAESRRQAAIDAGFSGAILKRYE